MIQRLKQRAKRILYLLKKNTNCKLYEFSFGDGKEGQVLSMKVLSGLIKKDLVAKTIYKHGHNQYYLTDNGEKIAKPIIDEIDEYKRW